MNYSANETFLIECLGGYGGGKCINVGTRLGNSIFYDYTGNVQEDVYVDQEGNGIFYCNGGSVSVWVKK